MNISALIDAIQWADLLLIFGSVFGTAALLFRRASFGLYDPGWIVIAALSVAVTLITYLRLVEEVGTVGHAVYMACTLLGFLFGIRGACLLDRPPPSKVTDRVLPLPPRVRAQHKELRRALAVLNALLVIVLGVRAITQGLPIFAVDPELAKVEVNTQGFGLLTRLMTPASTIGMSIAFLLHGRGVFDRPRLLLALAPALAALLTSGSKGALVSVLVSFTSVQVYLAHLDPAHRGPRPARVVLFGGAAILGYALIVLLLRGAGVADGTPLDFALTTLRLRLVAYGDGVFYYFANDLYKGLSFSAYEYLWDYFAVPPLALARLVDYPMSLGLKISSEMFGQGMTMGPNPTVFVEGYAYFGVAGVLYASCIGILFQRLRSAARVSAKRASSWAFLRFVLLFSLAQLVASDMILFIGEAINSMLVLALVWLASLPLHKPLLPRIHRVTRA